MGLQIIGFGEARQAAKFRCGDARAFREIYDRHAPRVMGYLVRLTGDRADAEDLVQEVFVAAYQGRDSFQGQSRMLAWLLGIAVRRWRDRCRGRRLDLADVEPAVMDALPDRSSGSRVEDSVIASITLGDSLLQLAPLHREALLLVAGQGLTYAEAATITGEPIGTVKWRVSMATRTLRQHLADPATGDVDAPSPGDARKGESQWRANA